MVRDEIKSFTYIIPYVCSRCGSRHSTLKKKYREKWNFSIEALAKENLIVSNED
jgi:hypothetical protein